MPGLAIVAPVSFGDTTLPKLDVTPLQRVLGATYDWAADKVTIGSMPVWYDMIQGAQFVAPSTAQAPIGYQSTRKVVRMDGINQRYDISMDLSGAKTMVVVGRLATSAASTYLVTGGTGPSFNIYIGGNGKFATTAGTSLSSTLVGDTNTHVFIVVSNGTSSVFSIDGTEVAGPIGTSTANALRLAATSTAYASADFQRVAILPYAATPAQRAAIMAQMKAQYSIA